MTYNSLDLVEGSHVVLSEVEALKILISSEVLQVVAIELVLGQNELKSY